MSFTLQPGANGILPDRMIAAMADAGLILPDYPFVESQIQPASLDLRLGDIAYRVRASFLPGPGATVAKRIDELKLHEISLADGAVLETNCVYIVPLLESLALPKEIVAAANPKSSTGRLDVFTRVIADGTRRFDMIGAGYHGPLYAEISPKTFPVLLREGSRLSQVRFRTGEAIILSGEEIQSERIREWGIRSVVSVPITGRGEVRTIVGLGLLPVAGSELTAASGVDAPQAAVRMHKPTAAAIRATRRATGFDPIAEFARRFAVLGVKPISPA